MIASVSSNYTNIKRNRQSETLLAAMIVFVIKYWIYKKIKREEQAESVHQ